MEYQILAIHHIISNTFMLRQNWNKTNYFASLQ